MDVNYLMSNFHLRRWSLTPATSVGASYFFNKWEGIGSNNAKHQFA